MKKSSPIARGLSLGMTLVFTYVNVIYGAIEPARSFWQDRKTAAEKINGNHGDAAPQSQSQAADEPAAQVSRPQENVLLAQLPSLNQDMLSTIQSAGIVSQAQNLGGSLPANASGGVSPASLLSLQKSLPDWFKSIPMTHASLKDLYIPPGWKPSDLMVVHIQDAHENAEAQRNIAKIMEAVARGLKSERAGSAEERSSVLIGIEGARGPFNFAPFRAFPDPDVTREIASHFLKESFITGPEYVGMTYPQDPKTSGEPALLFWGVEDEQLYLDHVQALKDSAPYGKEAEEFHKKLDQRIGALKEKIFNPRLKELDAAIGGYRSGKIKLGNYLETLTGPYGLVGRMDYPMTDQFLTALAIEETLRYDQVEKERKSLTENLAAKLPRSELQNLVQASLSFRMGDLTHGAFYKYLVNVCRSYRVDLSRFPEMDKYIRYILISEKIRPESLFREMEKIEKERLRAETVTPDEKKLVELGKDCGLMGKLVRFSLSPQEWESFESRRGEIEKMEERIARLGGGDAGKPSALGGLLSRFARFNECAIQRNDILVENLLMAAGSGAGDISQFSPLNPDASPRGRKDSSSDGELLSRLKESYKNYFSALPVKVTGIKKIRERYQADGRPENIVLELTLLADDGARSKVRLTLSSKDFAGDDGAEGKPVLEMDLLGRRVKVHPARNGALNDALETVEERLGVPVPAGNRTQPASRIQAAALSGSGSKPLHAKPAAAVLIAGGFHTEGVTKLLKEKKVAYAVLTPRIGKVEGTGTEYLDVFTRDKTPLEKLFTGERITLAKQTATPLQAMGEAPALRNAVLSLFTAIALAAGVHLILSGNNVPLAEVIGNLGGAVRNFLDPRIAWAGAWALFWSAMTLGLAQRAGLLANKLSPVPVVVRGPVSKPAMTKRSSLFNAVQFIREKYAAPVPHLLKHPLVSPLTETLGLWGLTAVVSTFLGDGAALWIAAGLFALIHAPGDIRELKGQGYQGGRLWLMAFPARFLFRFLGGLGFTGLILQPSVFGFATVLLPRIPAGVFAAFASHFLWNGAVFLIREVLKLKGFLSKIPYFQIGSKISPMLDIKNFDVGAGGLLIPKNLGALRVPENKISLADEASRAFLSEQAASLTEATAFINGHIKDPASAASYSSGLQRDELLMNLNTISKLIGNLSSLSTPAAKDGTLPGTKPGSVFTASEDEQKLIEWVAAGKQIDPTAMAVTQHRQTERPVSIDIDKLILLLRHCHSGDVRDAVSEILVKMNPGFEYTAHQRRQIYEAIAEINTYTSVFRSFIADFLENAGDRMLGEMGGKTLAPGNHLPDFGLCLNIIEHLQLYDSKYCSAVMRTALSEIGRLQDEEFVSCARILEKILERLRGQESSAAEVNLDAGVELIPNFHVPESDVNIEFERFSQLASKTGAPDNQKKFEYMKSVRETAIESIKSASGDSRHTNLSMVRLLLLTEGLGLQDSDIEVGLRNKMTPGILAMLNPERSRDRLERPLLLKCLNLLKLENTENGRLFIAQMTQTLDDLAPDEFNDYLKVVARMPRSSSDAIPNLPDHMTWGIENEIWLVEQSGDYNQAATLELLADLQIFISENEDLKTAFTVDQDQDAIEIRTVGGIDNSKEGILRYQAGTDKIINHMGEWLNAYKTAHRGNLNINWDMHVHDGHPDVDARLLHTLRSMGVIGKSLEGLFNWFQPAGFKLSTALNDRAILGSDGLLARNYLRYDTDTGTFEIRCFEPPMVEMDPEHRHIRMNQIIGISLNILANALKRPDDFSILSMGLPVLAEFPYTLKNHKLFMRHIRHLYGENNEGLISLMQFLIDTGRLPQDFTADDPLGNGQYEKRVEKLFESLEMPAYYEALTELGGWSDNLLADIAGRRFSPDLTYRLLRDLLGHPEFFTLSDEKNRSCVDSVREYIGEDNYQALIKLSEDPELLQKRLDAIEADSAMSGLSGYYQTSIARAARIDMSGWVRMANDAIASANIVPAIFNLFRVPIYPNTDAIGVVAGFGILFAGMIQLIFTSTLPDHKPFLLIFAALYLLATTYYLKRNLKARETVNGESMSAEEIKNLFSPFEPLHVVIVDDIMTIDPTASYPAGTAQYVESTNSLYFSRGSNLIGKLGYTNNSLYNHMTRTLYIHKNVARSGKFMMGLTLAHESGKLMYYQGIFPILNPGIEKYFGVYIAEWMGTLHEAFYVYRHILKIAAAFINRFNPYADAVLGRPGVGTVKDVKRLFQTMDEAERERFAMELLKLEKRFKGDRMREPDDNAARNRRLALEEETTHVLVLFNRQNEPVGFINFTHPDPTSALAAFTNDIVILPGLGKRQVRLLLDAFFLRVIRVMADHVRIFHMDTRIKEPMLAYLKAKKYPYENLPTEDSIKVDLSQAILDSMGMFDFVKLFVTVTLHLLLKLLLPGLVRLFRSIFPEAPPDPAQSFFTHNMLIEPIESVFLDGESLNNYQVSTDYRAGTGPSQPAHMTQSTPGEQDDTPFEQQVTADIDAWNENDGWTRSQSIFGKWGAKWAAYWEEPVFRGVLQQVLMTLAFPAILTTSISALAPPLLALLSNPLAPPLLAVLIQAVVFTLAHIPADIIAARKEKNSVSHFLKLQANHLAFGIAMGLIAAVPNFLSLVPALVPVFEALPVTIFGRNVSAVFLVSLIPALVYAVVLHGKNNRLALAGVKSVAIPWTDRIPGRRGEPIRIPIAMQDMILTATYAIDNDAVVAGQAGIGKVVDLKTLFQKMNDAEKEQYAKKIVNLIYQFEEKEPDAFYTFHVRSLLAGMESAEHNCLVLMDDENIPVGFIEFFKSEVNAKTIEISEAVFTNGRQNQFDFLVNALISQTKQRGFGIMSFHDVTEKVSQRLRSFLNQYRYPHHRGRSDGHLIVDYSHGLLAQTFISMPEHDSLEGEVLEEQDGMVQSRYYLDREKKPRQRIPFDSPQHTLLYNKAARFVRTTADNIETLLQGYLPDDPETILKLKRALRKIEAIKPIDQPDGLYGNCFLYAPVVAGIFLDEGINAEYVSANIEINVGTERHPIIYNDIHWYVVVTVNDSKFVVDVTAEQFEYGVVDKSFDLMAEHGGSGSALFALSTLHDTNNNFHLNYGTVFIPYELAVRSNLPYVSETIYNSRGSRAVFTAPLGEINYPGIHNHLSDGLYDKLHDLVNSFGIGLAEYFGVGPGCSLTFIDENNLKIRTGDRELIIRNMTSVQSLYRNAANQAKGRLDKIIILVFMSSDGSRTYLTKRESASNDGKPATQWVLGKMDRNTSIEDIYDAWASIDISGTLPNDWIRGNTPAIESGSQTGKAASVFNDIIQPLATVKALILQSPPGAGPHSILGPWAAGWAAYWEEPVFRGVLQQVLMTLAFPAILTTSMSALAPPLLALLSNPLAPPLLAVLIQAVVFTLAHIPVDIAASRKETNSVSHFLKLQANHLAFGVAMGLIAAVPNFLSLVPALVPVFEALPVTIFGRNVSAVFLVSLIPALVYAVVLHGKNNRLALAGVKSVPIPFTDRIPGRRGEPIRIPIAMQDALTAPRSLPDAGGISFELLKTPEWLGPEFLAALKARNGGRDLPVINVSGVLVKNPLRIFDTSADRYKQAGSNAAKVLSVVSEDPGENPYLYALVHDTFNGMDKYRIIVGKRSVLNERSQALLETSLDISSEHNMPRIHQGNGDVLFVMEFEVDGADREIYFESIIVNKSLEGNRYASRLFANFSQYIKDLFRNMDYHLKIKIVSPASLALFLRAFPAAQPQEKYRGDPSWKNMQVFTADLDIPGASGLAQQAARNPVVEALRQSLEKTVRRLGLKNFELQELPWIGILESVGIGILSLIVMAVMPHAPPESIFAAIKAFALLAAAPLAVSYVVMLAIHFLNGVVDPATLQPDKLNLSKSFKATNTAVLAPGIMFLFLAGGFLTSGLLSLGLFAAGFIAGPALHARKNFAASQATGWHPQFLFNGKKLNFWTRRGLKAKIDTLNFEIGGKRVGLLPADPSVHYAASSAGLAEPNAEILIVNDALFADRAVDDIRNDAFQILSRIVRDVWFLGDRQGSYRPVVVVCSEKVRPLLEEMLNRMGDTEDEILEEVTDIRFREMIRQWKDEALKNLPPGLVTGSKSGKGRRSRLATIVTFDEEDVLSTTPVGVRDEALGDLRVRRHANGDIEVIDGVNELVRIPLEDQRIDVRLAGSNYEPLDADLPDGTLGIIGSGSPGEGPTAAGFIKLGENAFALTDLGLGTMEWLRHHAVHDPRVMPKMAFLTHLHEDHSYDLFEMLLMNIDVVTGQAQALAAERLIDAYADYLFGSAGMIVAQREKKRLKSHLHSVPYGAPVDLLAEVPALKDALPADDYEGAEFFLETFPTPHGQISNASYSVTARRGGGILWKFTDLGDFKWKRMNEDQAEQLLGFLEGTSVLRLDAGGYTKGPDNVHSDPAEIEDLLGRLQARGPLPRSVILTHFQEKHRAKVEEIFAALERFNAPGQCEIVLGRPGMAASPLSKQRAPYSGDKRYIVRLLFPSLNLTDEEWALLADNLEEISYDAKKTLLRQGGSNAHLYFVARGALEVTIDGRKVRTVGGGSILGERSFLGEVPPATTVRAISSGAAYRLSRDKYRGLPESLREKLERSVKRIDESRIAILDSDLFKGLPANVAMEVAELCVPRKLEKGEPIFTQGESGNEGLFAGKMVLIKKGTVRLTVGGDYRDTARTHEAIGEMAFLGHLDGRPGARTASANADEDDTEILVIDWMDLQKLADKYPIIGLRLADHYLEKMKGRDIQPPSADGESIGSQLGQRLKYDPDARTLSRDTRVLTPLGNGWNTHVYALDDIAVRVLYTLDINDMEALTVHLLSEAAGFVHMALNGLSPRCLGYGVTSDGTPFTLVERIEGRSIDKMGVLRQEELDDIKQLILTMVRQGAVLGDFKPANIMIGTVRNSSRKAWIVDPSHSFSTEDEKEGSPPANTAKTLLEILRRPNFFWASHDPEGQLEQFVARIISGEIAVTKSENPYSERMRQALLEHIQTHSKMAPFYKELPQFDNTQASPPSSLFHKLWLKMRSGERLTRLEKVLAPLGEPLFVAPTWETGALVGITGLIKMATGLGFFDPLGVSWPAVGIILLIGTLAARIHADVQKDYSFSSFARWFGSFALFASLLMFLPASMGIPLAWTLHHFSNGLNQRDSAAAAYGMAGFILTPFDLTNPAALTPIQAADLSSVHLYFIIVGALWLILTIGIVLVVGLSSATSSTQASRTREPTAARSGSGQATRLDFIKLATLAALSLILTSCGLGQAEDTSVTVSPPNKEPIVIPDGSALAGVADELGITDEQLAEILWTAQDDGYGIQSYAGELVQLLRYFKRAYPPENAYVTFMDPDVRKGFKTLVYFMTTTGYRGGYESTLGPTAEKLGLRLENIRDAESLADALAQAVNAISEPPAFNIVPDDPRIKDAWGYAVELLDIVHFSEANKSPAFRNRFANRLTPKSLFYMMMAGGQDGVSGNGVGGDGIAQGTFDILYEAFREADPADQIIQTIPAKDIHEFTYSLGRYGRLPQEAVRLPETYFPAIQHLLENLPHTRGQTDFAPVPHQDNMLDGDEEILLPALERIFQDPFLHDPAAIASRADLEHFLLNLWQDRHDVLAAYIIKRYAGNFAPNSALWVQAHASGLPDVPSKAVPNEWIKDDELSAKYYYSAFFSDGGSFADFYRDNYGFKIIDDPRKRGETYGIYVLTKTINGKMLRVVFEPFPLDDKMTEAYNNTFSGNADIIGFLTYSGGTELPEGVDAIDKNKLLFHGYCGLEIRDLKENYWGNLNIAHPGSSSLPADQPVTYYLMEAILASGPGAEWSRIRDYMASKDENLLTMMGWDLPYLLWPDQQLLVDYQRKLIREGIASAPSNLLAASPEPVRVELTQKQELVPSSVFHNIWLKMKSGARLSGLEKVLAPLGEPLFVAPTWETGALLGITGLIKMATGLGFFDPLGVSWPAVSIILLIGALAARIHADVQKDYSLRSFVLWFGSFALFTSVLMFLPAIMAIPLAWILHHFGNRAAAGDESSLLQDVTNFNREITRRAESDSLPRELLPIVKNGLDKIAAEIHLYQEGLQNGTSRDQRELILLRTKQLELLLGGQIDADLDPALLKTGPFLNRAELLKLLDEANVIKEKRSPKDPVSPEIQRHSLEYLFRAAENNGFGEKRFRLNEVLRYLTLQFPGSRADRRQAQAVWEAGTQVSGDIIFTFDRTQTAPMEEQIRNAKELIARYGEDKVLLSIIAAAGDDADSLRDEILSSLGSSKDKVLSVRESDGSVSTAKGIYDWNNRVLSEKSGKKAASRVYWHSGTDFALLTQTSQGFLMMTLSSILLPVKIMMPGDDVFREIQILATQA